ncbi:MAG: hypothetical protein A3G18_02820 [Rhodospirillales bacterium RIFCSPLOWO2_12_FULL_58_28]|nr:MAG: hypothetical protein A3H92_00785 [Rhodospirillales bacterium RIFCSPLOWO2_02_FULL_58_16]OHC77081.1 MAG: hypothetical protein A3G18_02820 [Rhodospirillales bacterium RIFCSPLOWO2_12_FULL_58_28]
MVHKASPFTAAPSGVKVNVKLAPKAGHNRISGFADDADGNCVLKASVTAAPEGGKANAALIRMLAKEWGLPKTSLEVAVGASGRRKTLFIKGDAEMLGRRLNQWADNARE